MKTKYIHCWIWRDLNETFQHATINRIDYGHVHKVTVDDVPYVYAYQVLDLEQRISSIVRKQYIYAMISR